MVEIWVCPACGASPASGISVIDCFPDERCECGECEWTIYDVDPSELEDFDSDDVDEEDLDDEDTCEDW